jgi:hypothetical protein
LVKQFKWLVATPKHWLRVLGVLVILSAFGLFLFILGFFLTSCPNPIQRWHALTQLNNYEKLWHSKNVGSYQFQVESMSLGYEWIEKIQVKNGVIISEIFNGPVKGAKRPDYFDNLNTLDKVFTDARNSLSNEQGMDLFTIKYDKNMGYPLEINYQNVSPLVRDACSVIRISNFQILK